MHRFFFSPSNKKICSDRGKCYNGSCECGPRKARSAQRYSGKYCECDDYSCSYSDDRLCGGEFESLHTQIPRL